MMNEDKQIENGKTTRMRLESYDLPVVNRINRIDFIQLPEISDETLLM